MAGDAGPRFEIDEVEPLHQGDVVERVGNRTWGLRPKF